MGEDKVTETTNGSESKTKKKPEPKTKVDVKPTPVVNEYLENKIRLRNQPKGVLSPGLSVEDAKVLRINLINKKVSINKLASKAQCDTKDLDKAFDNAIKSISDRLQGHTT